MKKAVLLLGMVTLIAGCIYLKNADKDTVLFKQQIEEEVVYAEEYPIEYTEEIIKPEEVETKDIEEDTTAEGIATSREEASVTLENTEEAEKNMEGYIFPCLNPEEQKVYVEILNSLLTYEKETELSTTDAAVIAKAFKCVMLEHPEIFFVDGYKYTEYTSNNTVEKIIFSGKYLYDEEEILARKYKIEEAADKILAGVPDEMDEYYKVKYIYDTLVTQTEYDIQSVDNQNICSVFLNGKSVCQGYAKAMQYLLQKLDIESMLVMGTVTNGDGHAWNLVSVNDKWYYLDATWGDAFYFFSGENEAVSSEIAMINYDYFCVTTEQIMRTHSMDMPIELPLCSSMEDNYYVREGLYFTSFDEAGIRNAFDRALENGQNAVTIKCSEQSVYEEVCRILLTEQQIFEYLNSDSPVAYTDDEEQYSLTFWL